MRQYIQQHFDDNEQKQSRTVHDTRQALKIQSNPRPRVFYSGDLDLCGDLWLSEHKSRGQITDSPKLETIYGFDPLPVISHIHTYRQTNGAHLYTFAMLRGPLCYKRNSAYAATTLHCYYTFPHSMPTSKKTTVTVTHNQCKKIRRSAAEWLPQYAVLGINELRTASYVVTSWPQQ